MADDLLTGEEQNASGEDQAETTETIVEPGEETTETEVETETIVEPGEETTETEEEGGEEQDDGPPEEYEDFTLPEGMELDSDALEIGTPMLKELGLSQDKAQKVIDHYSQIRQAEVGRMQEAIEKRNAAWDEDLATDKEVGGEKLAANSAMVKKIFNTFDTDKAAAKYLAETGQASCSPIFKMFARMASHFEEDTFVSGNSSKGSGVEATRAEKLGYKSVEDY